MRNNLIERYFSLSHYPTLRGAAQETGIQVSRIFRIMKRGNLKVEEWKIFARLACQKLGLEDDLLSLAEDCLAQLQKEDLEDLIHYMQRALRYRKIFQDNELRKNIQQLAAPAAPADPCLGQNSREEV